MDHRFDVFMPLGVLELVGFIGILSSVLGLSIKQ